MSKEVIINLIAILSLIPITVFGFRKSTNWNQLYWPLLTVAVFGSLTTLVIKLSGTWYTDLSTSVWATIAATMLLFLLTVALMREASRLVSLISGYMIILGILASLLDTSSDKILMPITNFSLWISLHILMSITTYGLLTIAAVSAFSAAVQEYLLKAKIQNPLYQLLPSITDCDKLSVKLLIICEAILGVGLISGMGLGYIKYHDPFPFNHKTILTITAFIVIAILLIAHFRIGIRGRRAARYVLCAYLLMTLGYPGVKFVSDVILK